MGTTLYSLQDTYLALWEIMTLNVKVCTWSSRLWNPGPFGATSAETTGSPNQVRGSEGKGHLPSEKGPSPKLTWDVSC